MTTINRWTQILVFYRIVTLLVKPLGGYMTHVFNGERSFLSSIVGPIERSLYRMVGTGDREELVG
jgi:K+-transporting ATPase ATPase A chain